MLPRPVQLIALVALLSACDRGVKTSDASEVSGPGYSVAVPNGFTVVTDERMKQVTDNGGAVLAAKDIGRGTIKPTIVVMPIVPAPPFPEELTVQSCEQLAAGLAEGTGAVMTKVETPELPFGRSCRYQLRDGQDANRVASAVIIHHGDRVWMVMCNRDNNDRLAAKAFDRLIADFKFTD